MWQDLAVLTPSLVVCAAFLAGVFVLLRREMAPRRRGREGNRPPVDMSGGGEISELEDDGPSATSDYEETADPQTGRRSRDYPR
jgi:hypothetical protein